MSLLDDYRLDRTKLSVGSLDEPSDEKAFWLSQTPAERLRALEYLKQNKRAAGRNKDLADLENLP